MARITLFVESSVYFPLSAKPTPITCPSLRLISVTVALKRTSPPRLIILFLIPLTVSFNRSVPICGLLKYSISGGAPASISSLRIIVFRASKLPILSFPSEKAPAPPSPNCTLEFVSRTPERQNVKTLCLRLSTSGPRSNKMGLAPACAKISAANNPAGPAPTTIGRICNFFIFGKVYINSISFWTLLSLFIQITSFSSPVTRTTTVIMK